MKKLAIALMLAMTLAISLASAVMANGPGVNGQGAVPTAEPPPNEVYVPTAAYEARGPIPPGQGTDWNNGALFYTASQPGPD
jgi:hypothetical protein